MATLATIFEHTNRWILGVLIDVFAGPAVYRSTVIGHLKPVDCATGCLCLWPALLPEHLDLLITFATTFEHTNRWILGLLIDF